MMCMIRRVYIEVNIPAEFSKQKISGVFLLLVLHFLQLEAFLKTNTYKILNI